MSKALRPTLAALLGLAAMATAETAPAAPREAERRHATEVGFAHVAFEPITTPERSTLTPLRRVIEKRAEACERARRYEDLDQLTTLWLTLEGREQLDRAVARADQFVNVSLRNQKRSEQRAVSRAVRRTGADAGELELPAWSIDPDEAIDAEAFVASLDEPYRSAVVLSLTGMNHREVADKMGASHAAVRKWAQRLRDRLIEDGWDLSAELS